MSKRTDRRLLVLPGILLCALCFVAIHSLSAQEVYTGLHEVSRDVIRGRLQRLRPNIADRETELHKMFEEAGCTDLQEQAVTPKDPPNLICTLAGSGDSIIVVGADLNHVRFGVGIADNWSGASLLPSIFQALKDVPRTHTILFIGFTGEEKGLAGSKFFVRQFPKEKLALTKAMVDVVCTGYSSTKASPHSKDTALLDLAVNLAASMRVSVQNSAADCIGDDDSTRPFRDLKIPSITIHSLTKESASLVQTQYDIRPDVQIDKLYESYRVVTEYVSLLDQALP
jgi:hypothetical protein